PALEAELPQAVLDRLLGDLAIAVLARKQPGMQVGRHEQRVVVEHLLEVRDEPLLVDRVAVEAAADEVVHAARAHAVERAEREVERAAAEQELDRRGGRELRRTPE